MGSILPAPLPTLRIETASGSGFSQEQMGLRAETALTRPISDGGLFNTRKGDYVGIRSVVVNENGVGIVERTFLDNGGGSDNLVQVQEEVLDAPATQPAPVGDTSGYEQTGEGTAYSPPVVNTGGYSYNPDEIIHQPLPETGGAPSEEALPTETQQPVTWWEPQPAPAAPADGCETVENWYLDFDTGSYYSIVSHNAGGGSWNQVG